MQTEKLKEFNVRVLTCSRCLVSVQVWTLPTRQDEAVQVRHWRASWKETKRSNITRHNQAEWKQLNGERQLSANQITWSFSRNSWLIYVVGLEIAVSDIAVE